MNETWKHVRRRRLTVTAVARVVVALLMLTLGCSSGTDGDSDPQPEPCGGECPESAPHCLTDESTSSDGTCVECLSQEHCTSPDASRCDESNNECVPCVDDAHCESVAEAELCVDRSGDGSACVECTFLDDSACEDGECDLRDYTCVSRSAGALAQCEECTSDGDCGEYMRCVPMRFGGRDLGRSYCLSLTATGCSSPRVTQISRDTVDGESGHSFCGVKETLTTCPATADLQASTSCDPANSGAECGIDDKEDGLCRDVGDTTQCTYECDGETDCPGDLICNTDATPPYCDEE